MNKQKKNPTHIHRALECTYRAGRCVLTLNGKKMVVIAKIKHIPIAVR